MEPKTLKPPQADTKGFEPMIEGLRKVVKTDYRYLFTDTIPFIWFLGISSNNF
jgi:hypothetical protein